MNPAICIGLKAGKKPRNLEKRLKLFKAKKVIHLGEIT
jgi:hypothetical protein